jgi:hypothetical protein
LIVVLPPLKVPVSDWSSSVVVRGESTPATVVKWPESVSVPTHG